jgi:hypothetical protein
MQVCVDSTAAIVALCSGVVSLLMVVHFLAFRARVANLHPILFISCSNTVLSLGDRTILKYFNLYDYFKGMLPQSLSPTKINKQQTTQQ